MLVKHFSVRRYHTQLDNLNDEIDALKLVYPVVRSQALLFQIKSKVKQRNMLKYRLESYGRKFL